MRKIFLTVMLFALVLLLMGCTGDNIKSEFGSLFSDEDADKINAINIEGIALMDEKKYEEAKELFLEALEYAVITSSSKKTELLGSTYNNLCYAYYSLNDYGISLEYGEKALEFVEKDDIIYTNYGNTLFALGRTDEAIEYYNMAIEENKEALYAYHGKGAIYYETNKYELALEMFHKYQEFDPLDLDTKLYEVYCNIYLKNYEDALIIVDKLIEENSDNTNIYDAKGELLLQWKGFESASEYYQEVAELFPDNVESQILLPSLLYNYEKYEEALDQFLKVSEKFSNNGEIQEWIVLSFNSMEDLEGALSYYEEVDKAGEVTYQLNTSIGDYLYNKTMYMESIPYYEKAIQDEPDLLVAYTNKLYALFYGKRYTKCLEASKEAQEIFPASYEILQLIGESYYYLNDYENAITYYLEGNDLNPSATLLAYIGEAYLMMDDYDNAKIYTDEALDMDPQNYTAQGIRETIRNREKPLNVQLEEFIQTNYLYYESNKHDAVIKELLNDTIEDNDKISLVVDRIKQDDDIFTYTITDEEYDLYYKEELEDVYFEYIEDTVYLRIYTFGPDTYNKVVEGLDEVRESDIKTLVVDLRGNGGGMTLSANNILDCLLPECVTSTLIYRDGNNYNYYSDASYIKFKDVMILVDQYSASASELLTLGLDTYLNNVTILGEDTFGKGVGQTVYYDSNRKLALYLVNHYWNVKQKNILETSIKPDVYIDSDNVEDYLEIIDEMNKK
ncbi:MAG: S41 family peptidase [Anaerocolumna sp.]